MDSILGRKHVYIIILIGIPGTSNCPLFWGETSNPPKQGPLFQPKRGAPFGFQVFICNIYDVYKLPP